MHLIYIKKDLLNDFKKVIVPTFYMSGQLDMKNVEVIQIGIDIDKFKPIKE